MRQRSPATRPVLLRAICVCDDARRVETLAFSREGHSDPLRRLQRSSYQIQESKKSGRALAVTAAPG
jgi:hypothetical protein